MGRVRLAICTSCRPRKKWSGGDPAAFIGDDLFHAVKKLRKARGLKEVFAVDETECLKNCDAPCSIEFSGRKRSTYTRVCVSSLHDVAAVVDAAVAYAALEPDRELPERLLPGESED